MLFDFQNTLLIISAVMNAFLGGLIFIKHRHRFENQIYTLNIVFIIWWVIAMICYRSIIDEAGLLFLAINLYLAPTFIASTFLYFTFFFPHHTVKNKIQKGFLVFIPNILVAALVLVPGVVITHVQPAIGSEHVITFGPLYSLYALYISLYFIGGLGLLVWKAFHSNDSVVKRQIAYLLGGYFIAATLAMGTNLILPWMGEFHLNWLGQALTLFMVVPVAYAIFKHRLFEGKVIAAELFVLLLNIFLLIRVLIPQPFEQRVLNALLFAGALGIGLLLIRSVNKEVQAREHIEKLASDLKKANKRLKELDKMKSEFVSIASHQLRSPLTAIRGYTSMLLEGSFGKLPKKAQDAVEKIDESGKFMTLSVEDYLNVSRIQSGNMKYEMEEFNLKKAAKEIVDTFRQEATKKGLVLSCRFDVDSNCIVKADRGKTRQIIQNLIDNAIKYTKEGSITVHVRDTKRPKRIYIDVVDTGIGMSEEAIDNLFEKFERAKNANEVNVTGTGLGLFVARKMAEGMGGTISAKSDGEGEGSTFTLELPRTS